MLDLSFIAVVCAMHCFEPDYGYYVTPNREVCAMCSPQFVATNKREQLVLDRYDAYKRTGSWAVDVSNTKPRRKKPQGGGKKPGLQPADPTKSGGSGGSKRSPRGKPPGRPGIGSSPGAGFLGG